MRDFGGMGGFDAIFGGGQRTRRDVRRGPDIKLSLRLTLAEVASGTTKSIKLRTLDVCGTCHGSGSKAGKKPTVCGTCGGAGEVRRQAQSLFGQFISVSPCPTCAGEGTVITDPCPTCHGEGRVKAERVVSIDVRGAAQIRHPRVTLLVGDSTAEETLSRVRESARGTERRMVVLDSDHHAAHVRFRSARPRWGWRSTCRPRTARRR